ncbi:methyltransferase [Marinobacter sp. VGCF2001]|uniref:methyltransferase n=1 Tax=Marinobacter sp. VGCF2001 TaxID=3417189 RepID=UPI003CEB2FCA
MSALPNTHEVLLRNLNLVEGRPALLGVSDAGLLPECPVPGLAMTEHAGLWQSLAGDTVWEGCYGYEPEPSQGGSYDTVVVFLPKARAEFELRLALARYLAAPGAVLLVIGEKKEGIAGAIKQFSAVAGDVVKVDSARHCQVWSGRNVDALSRFRLADWLDWSRVDCAGVELSVAGLPGVFSVGRLDDGTRLLLETLAESPLTADRVLDFACGAGVIGAWLHGFRRVSGGSPIRVDGIEVQAQAVFSARQTYLNAGVSGDIFAADGLAAIKESWPAVVSNPPFHSGVKTDTSMTEQFLSQVARHLAPGGELRLVANSFLPYEALIRRYVGPVEKLAQNRRFTVYRAVRKTLG